MHFEIDTFERLLPSYLVDDDKKRLKLALEQFYSGNPNEINYKNFYADNDELTWFQGDIINGVPFIEYDFDKNECNKIYKQSILLSNTCDVSSGNERYEELGAIFAPIIYLEDYMEYLKSKTTKTDKQINDIIFSIKKQLKTNILYLPENKTSTKHQKEMLACLDLAFSIPVKYLNEWIKTDSNAERLNRIESMRYASLSLFGLYLLVLKVSFHFCRLPEEKDRKVF
jgi:hypothetical protein